MHQLFFQHIFSFFCKTVFLSRMFRIFRINGFYQILSCGRIQVKFQKIAFILQSYYTHNLFGRKRLFPDRGQHFLHLWGNCRVVVGSLWGNCRVVPNSFAGIAENNPDTIPIGMELRVRNTYTPAFAYHKPYAPSPIFQDLALI